MGMERKPEGAGILWDGIQAWNGLCVDPCPIPGHSREEVEAPVATHPQSHGTPAGFGVQDFLPWFSKPQTSPGSQAGAAWPWSEETDPEAGQGCRELGWALEPPWKVVMGTRYFPLKSMEFNANSSQGSRVSPQSSSPSLAQPPPESMEKGRGTKGKAKHHSCPLGASAFWNSFFFRIRMNREIQKSFPKQKFHFGNVRTLA